MKSLLLPTTTALLSLLPTPTTSHWIDEDTPQHLRTTTSLVDGSTYHLIMSDEFNVPHRTFTDGHDPTWTALDKSDDDYSASGGGSLHFYNSSMVTTTEDGMLTIRSVVEDTTWTHLDTVEQEQVTKTTHFKSGMVQSWNKFCFTGGIMEVDIILPGEPDIGGLWPAVWLLGNLGRATYEASTNNIWPWSYNKCDRKKQQSQSISKCNLVNHFGLNSEQGRGATEIDLMELMAGSGEGDLPSTEPGVGYPYADMTLQVAPGFTENRPQSGAQPIRNVDHSSSGYATSIAQNWYNNLTVAGNTSLNPFFYGTYLAETKKGEPVTRSKKQAFQADAVGAMKQLVAEHFKTPHTFRVEWQPGRGGRLDWFTKSYKKVGKDGKVFHMEGDGKGQDWEHSFHIPDSALDEANGAQIPEEPSSIIFNTAISSTWGFPTNLPDWCPKCYDCNDPKCQCSFNPGFCSMMKTGNVAMKIDSVRVYQSRDDSAHSGQPHTVGCDPVEFPTREFIKGFEYRYMRNPPFVYEDKHPLRDVKNGGGSCKVDTDCGGEDAVDEDDSGETKAAEDLLDLDSSEEIQPKERRLAKKSLDKPPVSTEALVDVAEDTKVLTTTMGKPKGQCVDATNVGLFGVKSESKQCKCNKGYTGPHCLSVDKYDDQPGAEELATREAGFLLKHRANLYLTTSHIVIGGIFVTSFIAFLVVDNFTKKRRKL